ncbi:unnamed protein product, partial [Darwinula stevensoni]
MGTTQLLCEEYQLTSLTASTAKSSNGGVDMKHDGIIERLEDLRKYTIGDKRKNPLREARDFVRGEFPDWKDGCHVLPVFAGEAEGDAAGWEVAGRIHECALGEKQPMFVVAYARNGDVGGEMDVVVVHRFVGAWCFRPSLSRKSLGWLAPGIPDTLSNTASDTQTDATPEQRQNGPSKEKLNVPGPAFASPYMSSLMQWVVCESQPWIRTVEGVAGTGKTWILTESASNILVDETLSRSNDPKRPMLVLCFNRPLAQYLEHEIFRATKEKLGMKNSMYSNIPLSLNMTVKTFDAFMEWRAEDTNNKEKIQLNGSMQQKTLRKREGNKVVKFHHIFVDEAMD